MGLIGTIQNCFGSSCPKRPNMGQIGLETLGPIWPLESIWLFSFYSVVMLFLWNLLFFKISSVIYIDFFGNLKVVFANQGVTLLWHDTQVNFPGEFSA